MGVGGRLLSGEGVRRSLIVLGMILSPMPNVDKRNEEIAGIRVAAKKFRSKSAHKALSRLCLSHLPRSLLLLPPSRPCPLPQTYSSTSLEPLFSFALGNLISSLMGEFKPWREK